MFMFLEFEKKKLVLIKFNDKKVKFKRKIGKLVSTK